MSRTPIPKEHLRDGHYYAGEGRLGALALWDGERDLFYGVALSWGRWEVNPMVYGEKGFTPYRCIGNLNEVV